MTSTVPADRDEAAAAGLSFGPLQVVGALVLVVLVYSILALDVEIVATLIKEDGAVEWAGAFGLFVGAMLYFLAFRERRRATDWNVPIKTWALLGFAVLFFVAGGEEISWGQRVLGLATPEQLADLNVQRETNLHNLDALDDLVEFTRLFELLCAGLFVIVPVIVALHDPTRLRLRPLLPLMPLSLAVVFAGILLMPRLARTALESQLLDIPDHPVARGLDEIRESLLELLIAFTAYLAYRAAQAEGRMVGPTLGSTRAPEVEQLLLGQLASQIHHRLARLAGREGVRLYVEHDRLSGGGAALPSHLLDRAAELGLVHRRAAGHVEPLGLSI